MLRALLAWVFALLAIFPLALGETTNQRGLDVNGLMNAVDMGRRAKALEEARARASLPKQIRREFEETHSGTTDELKRVSVFSPSGCLNFS